MAKAKTTDEKRHLNKVASLGCIACSNMGYEDSPAEIHHIRGGQGLKRASHYEAIPLCPTHHRTGGYGMAFHAGKVAWEQEFGTERELLEQVLGLINA